MPRLPAASKRTWNKQIDENVKALDAMMQWLKRTFPPETKLHWSEVVWLERANHYLELAALQLLQLRRAKSDAASAPSLHSARR